MRKLFVIEGFDRIGKDTLLQHIREKDNPFLFIYKQYSSKINYRNTQEYLKWLNKNDQQLKRNLLSINNNIVLTRLFVSDYVYSKLFNRDLTIKTVEKDICNNFEIHQYIILYTSYDKYLERCKQCNCQVEYTEAEYNDINYYYKYNIYNRNFKTKIFYFDGSNYDDIEQQIYADINNVLDINLIDKLQHKKFMYIPVVSMRDYKTDLYNLECDSNVNRILTVLYQLYNCEATILLPSYHTQNSTQFINKHIQMIEKNNNKIKVDYVNFGKNALDTRLNFINDFNKYIITNNIDLNEYDSIVYEPNCLINYFKPIQNRKYELLYWCPVSYTINVKPPFLKNVEELDLECVNNSDITFVSFNSQKEYFKTKLEKDNKILRYFNVIKPQYFDDINYNNQTLIDDIKNNADIEIKNFVYLPFRLTDKGYRIEYILQTIKEVIIESNINIQVLYSDPNSSDDIVIKNEYKEFCHKTKQNNRQDFYNILKYFNKNNKDYKMLVICLEDANDIMHCSLFEFEYFNNYLMKKKTDYKYNNEIVVDDSNFKQSLINFFKDNR